MSARLVLASFAVVVIVGGFVSTVAAAARWTP